MMARNPPSENPRTSMSIHTNQYIREVLHASEEPPAIPVRYFYTSPLAIDDPLSPLPPPLTGSSASRRHPPRPFSVYDNDALNNTWLDLRRKILKHNEDSCEKRRSMDAAGGSINPAFARVKRKRDGSTSEDSTSGRSKARDIPSRDHLQVEAGLESAEGSLRDESSAAKAGNEASTSLSTSSRPLEPVDLLSSMEPVNTTGTPFIRAPSRTNIPNAGRQRLAEGRQRPAPREFDSYKWDDEIQSDMPPKKNKESTRRRNPKPGPSAKVPVGVSRLHNVVMSAESIWMEPIYWSPVNDIADVIRGTWFYKDTMLPVEVEVANMLELGYIELQPWTQTWTDELNSAIEVGAVGEEKIMHKLWPERSLKLESFRTTSRDINAGFVQNNLDVVADTPEKEREETVESACDLIDISTGPNGPDNKAAGDAQYGMDGRKRQYLKAGVIYANEKEAYLLRPNLQASAYYGRRPLANYIRKGRAIGICVCRGFDQEIWDRLHPVKTSSTAKKARQAVSTSQAGAPPRARQNADPTIAQSERPQVTDLILVIHGIGQKLSERIETYHFTHAINAFRREVNVELGTDSVKSHLRKDLGGIMVLPVNWRLRISMEDDAGRYSDEPEDPALNTYTLKDITPETLPSVRGIVSDVMLDIPYYLSQEHHPKMIAACIQEANRIYRLWCLNNPGFAEWGRVHIIAHSLGSVMAIDILSQQPSHLPPRLGDPSTPEAELPQSHFIFDTKSLFICGSPGGFFLLLKKATLLPRKDRSKPGAESSTTPGVAGDQGTYGCIAVDNIYNIVNPYDPVAYRLNATIDTAYAAMLKPGFVPSASSSWFTLSNPFKNSISSAEAAVGLKPNIPRLPSTVELETHNFSREEIAEKRAYLLNDNGQVDFFLKYGGGALEIQYLTMLGAHSSYWISKDFVRMIVVEVGREFGREGTVAGMRAVKKKKQIG
ncbi:DDHD domain-containing protein [Lepidopterella palustris CBS 459.81]|uniref:DDHD domain-containing protein n=1 Tax=Lepidopterella palustris CBS 459.81 TaxID=1314670 RepID=A0A8E2EG20_9PEZI|nr:DDHD domain-containing protein [Lepidopterella palustris CBS 459.81]